MLQRKLWLFAVAMLTAFAMLGVATPGPRTARADEPQDAGAFAAFTDLMVISEFLMQQQILGNPIYVTFTGPEVRITGMQPMADAPGAYEIATYDFAVGDTEVVEDAFQPGENRLEFRTGANGIPEGFQGEVVGSGEGKVVTGMSGPGGVGSSANTGEIGTRGGGTTNGGLPLGMGGLRDAELDQHRNSPASYGWGPFNSLIMASPSPCPNNSNQACTAYISWFHDSVGYYDQHGHWTQLQTKLIWREMFPSQFGAQRIYGPWYTFTNLTYVGSQTQIPFSVGYSHKYEFRMNDQNGVMLAHMEVSSGINGELLGEPAPCHTNGGPFCTTNISIEIAAPITRTQIWVNNPDYGPTWYLFEDGCCSGSWDAPWIVPAPGFVNFQVLDMTPGPTSGTVIQTKQFSGVNP